eukprot:TRINITY_DN17171_c0_g1_i5.p2 TRINITY_DN17171_c0_g1~~TRINITY_DN17171_c0_g1_i5.p2  ORF type:complete len:104 (+),score=22.49 TRINITY_DN17171_c0_g1_i5:130-441(+)
MIRRPPRSTQGVSSAASDVYKRQVHGVLNAIIDYEKQNKGRINQMSKLYFRYGAMNSGKSTHLMQVAHNYEERGMKVIIAKPCLLYTSPSPRDLSTSRMPSSA